MDWKITELRSFFILMLMSVLLFLPDRSFGQNQGALSNPFSSGIPQGQGNFGFSGGGFMPHTQEGLPSQEGSSQNKQAAPGPMGSSKEMGKPGLTNIPGQTSLSEQVETPGIGQGGALAAWGEMAEQ